ncbi:hypothetical protein WCLP8_200018 [uncultured Gammaproteobacteria bacterium]
MAVTMSRVDGEGLAVALAEGRCAYIEEIDGVPWGEWMAIPLAPNLLVLSLTTATAYGLHCAFTVCEALMSRGALPAARRSPVELCLHEAIANGIVHGNLGISSSAKDHPEGHRVFSQLVKERLRDPVCRRRRLEIVARWTPGRLDLGVSDQGEGFDPVVIPSGLNGAARSGRGFVFMRALSSGVVVTDDGRCTCLHFDL